MPIKSVQNKTWARRKQEMLPVVATLWKGGPKRKRKNRQGKEVEIMGEELSVWRCTSEVPGFVEAFNETFGGDKDTMPVSIEFGVIEETTDAVLDAWRFQWVGPRRIGHKCNGEYMVQWLEGGDYVYDYDLRYRKPCPGGCDPRGEMLVFLPAMWRRFGKTHPEFIGLVKVQTGSLYDISDWDEVLRMAERMGGPTGLVGQTFTLTREPRVISYRDEHGEKRRTNKVLAIMRVSGQSLQMMVAAAQRRALGLDGGDELVPVVDEATGEVLGHVTADEFYAGEVEVDAEDLPDGGDLPDEGEAQAPPADRKAEPEKKSIDPERARALGWSKAKVSELTKTARDAGLDTTEVKAAWGGTYGKLIEDGVSADNAETGILLAGTIKANGLTPEQVASVLNEFGVDTVAEAIRARSDLLLDILEAVSEIKGEAPGVEEIEF
jgi:hypothetical protein